MSPILDRLPYAATRGSIVVAGKTIAVLAHQIIVWVSVTPKTAFELGASEPRIPAILDTGNTFGFSITEQQLILWCGLYPNLLAVLGPIFINNQSLNRHAADVWIHRNRTMRRDTFRREAFRLELRDGIAVYPADHRTPQPRLPLLGLRAIDENRLRCTLNGAKQTVSLSAPSRDV